MRFGRKQEDYPMTWYLNKLCNSSNVKKCLNKDEKLEVELRPDGLFNVNFLGKSTTNRKWNVIHYGIVVGTYDQIEYWLCNLSYNNSELITAQNIYNGID